MSTRRTSAVRQGWLSVTLVVAIGILFTVVSSRWTHRFDLTADARYTLSPSTIGLLSQLDDRLQLKLYFSEDVEGAEWVIPLRAQIEDLFAEVVAHAGNRIQLEMVDPQRDVGAEFEAQRAGIRPFPITDQSRSGLKVLDLYQGLVLRYQDQERVLPFVISDQLEYQLASLIHGLLHPEPPRVGFFSRETPLPPPNQSYPQPPPADRVFQRMRDLLAEHYSVQDLAGLGDGVPVPTDLDLLVVAQPNMVTDEERFQLDQYLAAGGHVLILHDHESFDERMNATPIETGLDDWLRFYGLQVAPDFLFDQAAHMIQGPPTLVDLGGGRRVQVPQTIPYPLWLNLPKDALNAEHPVTSSIDQASFFWAHPVGVQDPPDGLTPTTLAASSEQSWLAPADAALYPTEQNLRDLQVDALNSGVPTSRRIVVALDGAFPSAFTAAPASSDEAAQDPPREVVSAAAPGLLVLVGDADAFTNDFLQANQAFAMNLVDWMAQSAELIAIRSRGGGAPNLRNFYAESLQEQGVSGARVTAEEYASIDRDAQAYKRSMERRIKLANLLLPPFLILLLGLLRYRTRRRLAARPYEGPAS